MSTIAADYELTVELPAGWNVLEAEQVVSCVGRLCAGTPPEAWRSGHGEPLSKAALIAAVTVPIGLVATGVASIFIASVVIEVVSVDHEPSADPSTFSTVQVHEVPIAQGVTCPMVVSTVTTASDDGLARVVATFTSPNATVRNELEAGFAEMASRIRLRRKRIACTETAKNRQPERTMQR